jgi:AraC-like DNA-binding protein
MKYVEYFRTLKAMEFIATIGLKKAYLNVGYKTSPVFSKAFLRATGFNASCFYADEIAKYKHIIPDVYKVARKDPKAGIEYIFNYDNGSIRDILLAQQTQKSKRN